MARLGAAVRKDHAPGGVGDAAEQLGINEVSDAPKEKSDGSGAGQEVAEFQGLNAVLLTKQQSRYHDTEKTAMERHAALPDHEDLGRVVGEVGEVVEQYVAEAPTEEHAERRPDQKIIDALGSDVEGRHGTQVPHHAPGEH